MSVFFDWLGVKHEFIYNFTRKFVSKFAMKILTTNVGKGMLTKYIGTRTLC